MSEKKTNQFMIFMSKRMLACDEAGFLISKSRDAKLSFREKIGLRIHLMSCHLCRKYEKQIIQLNKMFGIYREECTHENCEHELPAGKKTSISVLVENELNTN